MQHFDKIIEAAAEVSDCNVEPQPLWESPATALGPPVQIMELDLTNKVPEKNVAFTGVSEVSDMARPVNGVELWMEWSLDEDNVVSGGPVDVLRLKYNIELVPSEGHFTFNFEPM